MNRTLALAAALAAPAAALAQFGTPGSTLVREKIVGELITSEDTPTPETGDQIGAFFQNEISGVFTYQSTSPNFEITIYGDNPETDEIEGPSAGQPVEFRFYDASTNTVTPNLRVLTPSGEPFNFTYQGELIPEFPFPLPGFDLTPTRNLDLSLAAATGDGGDGDGDGTGPNYDVDADGDVDTRDAALVLRLVTGAARGVSEDTLTRADVNSDGVVNTQDAIEILRNR